MNTKLVRTLAIGAAVIGIYAAGKTDILGRARHVALRGQEYVAQKISHNPSEAGYALAEKIKDYEGKAYPYEGLEAALTGIIQQGTPEIQAKAVELLKPVVAQNPQYAVTLTDAATQNGQNPEQGQEIISHTYTNLTTDAKTQVLHGFKPEIQKDGPFQWELLTEAADHLAPESSAVILRKSFQRLPPERQEEEVFTIYIQMPADEQSTFLKQAAKNELSGAYQAMKSTWLGKQIGGLFGGNEAEAATQR